MNPARTEVLAEPVRGSVALPFAEPLRLEIAPGATLAEIVEGAFTAGLISRVWAANLVVYVGDWEAPRGLWARTRPKPGQLVAIRARPFGGGDDKNPLNTLLQLVLIAVVAWVAGPGAAGLFSWAGRFAGVVQASAAGLTAVAGQMLINAIAPIPQPKLGAQPEQLFELRGARNEAAFNQPVLAVLGRHRVFPRLAAKPFTEVVNDKVYLRLLLSWGLGPIALDTASLKIADAALTEFPGVEAEHKLTPSDPWPKLFPSAADEMEVNAEPKTAEGWITRQTATAQADELGIDFTFPEGLWRNRYKDGTGAETVGMRVRYRKLGDADWRAWDTGAIAAEGSAHSWTANDQTPFRRTLPRRVVATRGTYEVGVKRESKDADSTIRGRVFWGVLRSFTFEPPVLDADAAVSAFRMESSEELTGVIDRLNGVVTRLAPKWTGSAFGSAGASRNPAELLRWIVTGPGAPRPRAIGEIDDAAFGAWAALCEAKGWKCDYLLMAGAAQSEIMQIVAAAGRAAWQDRAGKLTIVVDDVQPAPTQLFTPRNSWGFQGQLRFTPDTHALRVRFINEEKGWADDEIVVYYPGYSALTAELIEAIDLPAKTTPLEAARFGWRIIAETLRRREDFSWSADIENLTVSRGKRTAISHFAYLVGRRSARLRARVLNGGGTHVVALELDETIAQSAGETYGLKWRRVYDSGGGQGAIAIDTLGVTTTPGASNIVQLAAAIPVASAPQVDDLVTFGDSGIETLDVIVKDVVRRSDFEAEIAAVAYAPEVFADDATPLPEWSSNVSGDVFKRPPQPLVREVRATAESIVLLIDVPGLNDWLTHFELAWRESAAAPSAFTPLAAQPGSRRTLNFPQPAPGKFYDLSIVAVGAGGLRGPAAVVLEASLEAPPEVLGFAAYPGEDFVRYVWTRVEWNGGPLDYEIREGVSWENGVFVTRGESGTVTVKRPASTAGAPRYWIKARSLNGLSYSTVATEAVTFQAPSPMRNVILEHDFAASSWPGVKWDLTFSSGSLVLDAPGGVRKPFGDYYTEVDLGAASVYARNWIEATAGRVASGEPTWDDLDVAWDNLGDLTWTPQVAASGEADLRAFIATDLAQTRPADFVQGFRLNGALTGVVGALAPTSSSGVAYADCKLAQGLSLSADTAGAWWDLTSGIEIFTVAVDLKASGAAAGGERVLISFGEIDNDPRLFVSIMPGAPAVLALKKLVGGVTTTLASEAIEDLAAGELYTFALAQSATQAVLYWSKRSDRTVRRLAAAQTPLTTLHRRVRIGDGVRVVLGAYGDLDVRNSAWSEDVFADLAERRGPCGYDAFRELAAGDYEYEKAVVWFRLNSPGGVGDQLALGAATLFADVPDRLERGNASVSAGTWTTVTFGQAFRAAPTVTAQQVTGATAAAARVRNVSATNFECQLVDLAAPTTSVAGSLDWQALGY
jgi:hypothetical protein